VSDTPAHLRGGISSRLVDGHGMIHSQAWNRAVESKELVGSCRSPRGKAVCEGHLVADPTITIGRITWYEAHCLECGAVVVAPNGKTLPRSSRRDEMPDGAWDRRIEYLNKLSNREG